MPIYDYKCRGCGKQFEFLVLKSRVAACPGCGSRKLEQLPSSGIGISSAAIRQTNYDAARRAMGSSSDYRDQKVAQHEAQMHHIEDHVPALHPKNQKKKKKR